MRSSLLHVYHEESLLLGRIMHRELFHKNIIIRGIYFIEEGEVEATSGRVIARGWVTNGKCKNSGYGWRFKPFPFVRFLARNALVWKQFLNDIISNE